jgi:hypothetical protein
VRPPHLRCSAKPCGWRFQTAPGVARWQRSSRHRPRSLDLDLPLFQPDWTAL